MRNHRNNMLKTLFIENYALIDSLTIDFDNGFSVITGETGAGKSIILGALSLILGNRAESRHIKQNENKCVVEGVFDISEYNMESLFQMHDWQFEGNECIIRREIWRNGKSRAFVNDSPVYLNDLKELGDRLIDIHSQHQNLSLNDNQFQLNALDILAHTKIEKTAFEESFISFQTEINRLKELIKQSKHIKQEQDYLQFQFDTLSDAKLQEGEQDLLENELSTLTHAEEIKSALYGIVHTFSGEDENIEQKLKAASDSLSAVGSHFSEAEELSKRVLSMYLELKDVREDATRYFDRIESDPRRQQEVENRLSLLFELQQKYGVQSTSELIRLQAEIEQKLLNIHSIDEQVAKQQQLVAVKESDMIAKSVELSKKRREPIKLIEQQMTEQISLLGMPHAHFRCEIIEKEQPDINGKENIRFIFSANKNVDLQPIELIASGGEISRVMLCLKNMIADAVALPTIIFDEIDTGTSGEIAAKMGTIMQEMSRQMQVIVISHLPQIAAKGSSQYLVYKDEHNETTTINIKKLSHEDRVLEIARMLSGAETTVEAIENAKVMLKN